MTTPFRLSEKSFRRYEPFIRALCEDPNKRIPLTIPGLSPATVIGRCRDAIIALRRNPELSPDLYPLFSRLDPEIRVGFAAEGPVLYYPQQTQCVGVASTWDLRPFPNERQVLDAICLLHHCRLLTSKSTVLTSEKDVLSRVDAFDIEVEQTAPETYTIL